MDPDRRGRHFLGLCSSTALLAVALAVVSGCATNANVIAPPSPTSANAKRAAALPASATFSRTTWGQTQTWIDQHPSDPRTPLFRDRLGGQPDTVWLTGGPRDLPNLTAILDIGRRTGTIATIALYNIPGRDDGVTPRSTGADATGYRTWVDRICDTIDDQPVVVIVEPDALWLADRQFRSDRTGFDERLTLLKYAVQRLGENPSASVYLEAGTSSGSVKAERMATLLRGAGVAAATGFAVNVSSFAATGPITGYADHIRTALLADQVPDPHYVVDTSRNGNPDWDNDTWCNPPGRRVGVPPKAHPDPTRPALDANLWIKAPGTSDGPCGIAPGSAGGDFIPEVAFDMVR